MSTIEKPRRQLFIDELEDRGIFVRTYDEDGMDRLVQAVNTLHRELCKYDNRNIRKWAAITVLELVDSYAKHQHLATLGDRAQWCPGDAVGGTCPGIKSGINSDCPRGREEA